MAPEAIAWARHSILLNIFQRQSRDQLAVMLQEIDPCGTHYAAFSNRAGENQLVAGPGYGRPFPWSNFGHVFSRRRINKLDHDHVRPDKRNDAKSQKL